MKYDNGIIKTKKFDETDESHIYAIGDCIGGHQLAHVASAEGRVAAEHMNQLQPDKIDKNMIPSCIYSSPEIAQIGLTEQEVNHKEMDYTMSKFPFSSIGKAIIEDNSEGFVKIIIDKQTNDILGVHIIGPNVTNMISDTILSILH